MRNLLPGGRSRNTLKYQTTHLFVPLAIESLGPMNGSGVDFLSTLSDKSKDPRETSFLFQRISIITQRMNAVAVAGCFPAADADQDGLCNSYSSSYNLDYLIDL